MAVILGKLYDALRADGTSEPAARETGFARLDARFASLEQRLPPR